MKCISCIKFGLKYRLNTLDILLSHSASSFADTRFPVCPGSYILHHQQIDWIPSPKSFSFHSTSFPFFIVNVAHFSIPKRITVSSEITFTVCTRLSISLQIQPWHFRSPIESRWFVFPLPSESPWFIFRIMSIVGRRAVTICSGLIESLWNIPLLMCTALTWLSRDTNHVIILLCRTIS